MRGTLVAGAVVAALAGTSAVVASAVSATTSLTLDELATAQPAFEAVGLGYGARVDETDVRRLAERLGVDVGQALDPADLDRVIAVATAPRPTIPTTAPDAPPAPDLDVLAEVLTALEVDFGTVVDPDDALALAHRLGVDVGTVVDAVDVERLLAAGERATARFPVVATVGGITIHQPAEEVALIGYHQSNHEGAQDLAPVDSRTPWTVLPTRGRLSGRNSAADIVIARGGEVRAPVTGTVTRAGTYTLYCEYRDDYAVIAPDERPGWEVKLLHIDGVRVRAGDRVVAGETVLAGGPTPLPFRSQVDDHNRTGWPHVHLEVVDPSIPNVTNPGSGGC